MREMFGLVRELHPEMEQGEIKLTFTSAMTSSLVFECDLADQPVRVSVPWTITPEVAFAHHVADRARFLAQRARSEATAAASRADAAREKAERFEGRAEALAAQVPAAKVAP